MDSRQQDDIGVAQKLVSSLIILFIITVIIGGLISSFKTYLNAKVITCISVDEPDKVADVLSNNISSEININDNKVIGNRINTTFLVSKEQNKVNNINIKVDGFAISVDDNTFGYVTSYEQREMILKDICLRYVEELGLASKDISKIKLTGNVQATQSKINISQLSSSGEISEEIYNASVLDQELLGIRMTAELSEEEIVYPEILFVSDEELYMGQEEVEDGTVGSKLVYKEVFYEGLSQVDEVVIGEELLVDSTPTIVRKGTKNPYFDGVAFLARPTDGGYLSSLFGEYRAASYHKGIDYAKNTGEDVFAAFEGKVINSGYSDGGYGNLIIVEHENDMRTYYAHLNDIYVSEGDFMEKGEVIGTVGNTGFSTGPHLHFELRVNNEPVNPINYIMN